MVLKYKNLYDFQYNVVCFNIIDRLPVFCLWRRWYTPIEWDIIAILFENDKRRINNFIDLSIVSFPGSLFGF